MRALIRESFRSLCAYCACSNHLDYAYIMHGARTVHASISADSIFFMQYFIVKSGMHQGSTKFKPIYLFEYFISDVFVRILYLCN